MQFLNLDECLEWSTSHGYECERGRPRPSLSPPGFRVDEFDIPNDAGKRIADCRFIARALELVDGLGIFFDDRLPLAAASALPSSTLLWVTEWGVWSSGQHMPLFKSLRRSFGETRSLNEAPGQLFGPGESEDFLSFLGIACLFLWDVAALPQGADRYLHLSHDEFGLVITTPQLTDQVRGRFERYGLELRTSAGG